MPAGGQLNTAAEILAVSLFVKGRRAYFAGAGYVQDIPQPHLAVVAGRGE